MCRVSSVVETIPPITRGVLCAKSCNRRTPTAPSGAIHSYHTDQTYPALNQELDTPK
jgi:hypothetical protein